MFGGFIDGSTATGALVLASNGSENFYHFMSRKGNKVLVEDSVLGLAGGRYVISVFTVMKDGLPFQRAVTTPTVVSVLVKTGMSDYVSIDSIYII